MTDKGEKTAMEAEMEEYRIEPAGTRIKKGLAVIVLAAGFIGSFMGLGIDMGNLWNGCPTWGRFCAEWLRSI